MVGCVRLDGLLWESSRVGVGGWGVVTVGVGVVFVFVVVVSVFALGGEPGDLSPCFL